MRSKGCSADFMRKFEEMVRIHAGTQRDLVRALQKMTCLKRSTIYNLLKVMKLERDILINKTLQERPQPTVLLRALEAPDPVTLAKEAIENEWTAERVRLEAARRKAAAQNGHAPRRCRLAAIIPSSLTHRGSMGIKPGGTGPPIRP